jgi:hypothetical protein
MARRKFASPTLEVQITQENHERAVGSASGGCLIADAIKEQYPHLSKVTVDMATIRATDRKQGVRFTWLTPPVAQHLLLGYDQGWPQATDRITLRRAVQVTRIKRNKGVAAAVAANRRERILEFEQRIAKGDDLTRGEKSALGRLRSSEAGPPAPDRPSSHGRSEVRVEGQRGTVVEGGPPRVQGKPHPNLLRGRDRHFGAKLADPGQAFNEAVEAAVAQRLAASGNES